MTANLMLFVYIRNGWHSSQMSCQNNMDVYWKKSWGRGIAYFKRLILCSTFVWHREPLLCWWMLLCSAAFLPLAPSQGAQPVLMSVSGWWMTGQDTASQSAGLSGPSPSLPRGWNMCHPPMRHLTTALPPSSSQLCQVLPALLCFSMLVCLHYGNPLAYLYCYNTRVFFFCTSFFPSLFTGLLISPALMFNPSCFFPSSPFSCGFAALQYLTASPL